MTLHYGDIAHAMVGGSERGIFSAVGRKFETLLPLSSWTAFSPSLSELRAVTCPPRYEHVLHTAAVKPVRLGRQTHFQFSVWVPGQGLAHSRASGTLQCSSFCVHATGSGQDEPRPHSPRGRP